ncbi:MAG: methyltransferase domain-containing protein [Deltaproteobacteria bacterium]|nr:methyltransferase domain-containing protein [Deltaproteobacteria bacterium]
MTGIDPSIASIDKAREHASQIGLDIDYRQGTGENLPFEESTFKMVYCCDVLEHVNNPEKVITEIVRVLEPGGIFFYDTINRTMGSKMVYIKLFQEWAWSSFMPNNLHDWNMFIKPEELISVMNRIGLLHHDIKGISPGVNPFKLVCVLRQCKKRAITYSELGRRVKMKVRNNTSIGYLGFAIKRK